MCGFRFHRNRRSLLGMPTFVSQGTKAVLSLLHVDVNDRRQIQGHQLRNDQSANHGKTQRDAARQLPLPIQEQLAGCRTWRRASSS